MQPSDDHYHELRVSMLLKLFCVTASTWPCPITKVTLGAPSSSTISRIISRKYRRKSRGNGMLSHKVSEIGTCGVPGRDMLQLCEGMWIYPYANLGLPNNRDGRPSTNRSLLIGFHVTTDGKDLACVQGAIKTLVLPLLSVKAQVGAMLFMPNIHLIPGLTRIRIHEVHILSSSDGHTVTSSANVNATWHSPLHPSRPFSRLQPDLTHDDQHMPTPCWKGRAGTKLTCVTNERG
eukprot:6868339-Pyramimonas_sp.AAC.1